MALPDTALHLVPASTPPAAPSKAALLAAHAATQEALHAEIARLTALAAQHALAMQWLQRAEDDVVALVMAQATGKDGTP